jgi:hypothetical protein
MRETLSALAHTHTHTHRRARALIAGVDERKKRQDGDAYQASPCHGEPAAHGAKDWRGGKKGSVCVEDEEAMASLSAQKQRMASCLLRITRKMVTRGGSPGYKLWSNGRRGWTRLVVGCGFGFGLGRGGVERPGFECGGGEGPCSSSGLLRAGAAPLPSRHQITPICPLCPARPKCNGAPLKPE